LIRRASWGVAVAAAVIIAGSPLPAVPETSVRSVEVEGRVVEQWAEKVAAEAGFASVDHTVELFGLCPDHQ